MCVFFKYIQIHTFYPPSYILYNRRPKNRSVLYAYYTRIIYRSWRFLIIIIIVITIIRCRYILLYYYSYLTTLIPYTWAPLTLTNVYYSVTITSWTKNKTENIFTINNPCILYEFRWFLSAIVTHSRYTHCSCTTQCM